MGRTTRRALIGAAATLAALPGALVLLGAARRDRETPIPPPALARATAAALAATAGGRVTGTEIDDEDSKYEVEVTMDDGRQLDVQLDAGFHVVSTKPDRGS
jgi:uncharacterized membrane protein YkoI